MSGTRLMMIQSVMFEIDSHQDQHPTNGAAPAQEFLEAENVSLRLLLAQAEIDARGLLAQAGIDAREREAADKLQKLILEELHHRIKNTLATVSAIASQSLRTATSIEHGQHAIEGRLVALGRAHDIYAGRSDDLTGRTSLTNAWCSQIQKTAALLRRGFGRHSASRFGTM